MFFIQPCLRNFLKQGIFKNGEIHMSGQYFGDRVNDPVTVESNEQPTKETPGVNWDLNAGRVREDTFHITDKPLMDSPDPAVSVDEMAVQMAPQNVSVNQSAPGTPTANAGSQAPLLDHVATEHFRTRWNAIQGQFVDEPRAAVQQADAMVTEVIEQLTQMFSSEHHSLEVQWKDGKDVSTEDLRKALQRYRSFFNRLMV
jgi:hypothetical protein